MEKQYDFTIGYSPLECVDVARMQKVILVNKKIIDSFFTPQPESVILVAGAGQGDEAELIFKEFKLNTIGVDINIVNLGVLRRRKGLSLHRQNLENLAFANNSFSIVYSYHVLEHVSNHLGVLRELRRVLSPGGVLFIGFPNRHRLFSYIGTSQKVSALEKIKWNINDYLYRVRGRFQNKYGAHAGFTEKEFLSDSAGIFRKVQPVRNEYMLIKYAGLGRLIRFAIYTGLCEVLFPSNYYICIK